MDTVLVLDALLVASLAGSVALVAALFAGSRLERSRHVQCQVVGYALLTCLGVFFATLVLRPGPAGCLSRSCAVDTDQAEIAGQVQRRYSLAGAGKFTDDPVGSTRDAGTGDAPVPVAGALILLWLAGVGLTAFRLARRRWAAMRLVRSAERVTHPGVRDAFETVADRLGHRRRLRLLRHPDVPGPSMAGTLRVSMFLPPGFEGRPSPEIEMVALHELAHARRHDPLVTLLGELTACVFWFHPLVWRAARRLRELQELAADSHVVQNGVRASRYAGFLLHTYRGLVRPRPLWLPGAHSMVGGCLLETRLRTLLDPNTRHAPPTRAFSALAALLFVLLCGGLTLAPASLQAVGLLTQERRAGSGELEPRRLAPDAIDEVVRPVFIDKMADFYVAGAAIAVVSEGEIVYRAGFGHREVYDELPVEPDRTIFRIGSITKVLTGVAVMQLVDRGLLDLDADVNDYLTGLRIPGTFEQPVRVRDLLTHTAGFDQIGLGRHVSSREEVRPLREFLAENLVRIRPPGELAVYDTYGITLAGHLVERVSGLPYDEYLRRHIFEPLGMHRSGIVVPPALEPDVAVGYEFRGEWFPQEWEFMNTDPASTVNATVTDMARFAIMMLEEGVFEGRRVLSEASARAMLTRQFANHPDQPGYGYTFWEDRSFGVLAFSHGGSMTGYASFLYLVPERDLGVFIAYNQESGALANLVLSRLLPALAPGRAAAPEMCDRWRGPIDLSRFTGTYANALYHHGDPSTGWRRQPFDVEAGEDGGIVFQGEPAYPVGSLAFQRADGLLLTFREDESGRITHVFANQAVYEKLR